MRISRKWLACSAFCWVLLTNSAYSQCIVVITTGGGHQFWEEVKAGAYAAGDKLKIPVHIRGPINELNFAGQNKLIHQLMNRGCKGLVLAPNSDKHQSTINDFKKRGIPTVFIDRDAAGERVSVIKTNNYAAGQMAAKEMAKALKGKGRVAVLGLHPDISSTDDREQGFIDSARASGLEVISHQYIGTRVGEARTKAFNFFATHPDIQGIFTPNESTTLGTIKALERMTNAISLIHIGFDASKPIIDALKSKKLHGFVLQRPFEMGYQGVTNIHRLINAQKIDEHIDTGATFITFENIDSLLDES